MYLFFIKSFFLRPDDLSIRKFVLLDPFSKFGRAGMPNGDPKNLSWEVERWWLLICWRQNGSVSYLHWAGHHFIQRWTVYRLLPITMAAVAIYWVLVCESLCESILKQGWSHLIITIEQHKGLLPMACKLNFGGQHACMIWELRLSSGGYRCSIFS